MTTATDSILMDPPPTDQLRSERQRVLDDLNLSMLFLETARIETELAAEDLDDASAGGGRQLRVRVLSSGSLTPAQTAALLCRVLHNRRIPSVEIDRIAAGVRLRCFYLLPAGRWRLDIFAPIA